MMKKHTFFSKNLILWYLKNKRDLPWRQTKDPYLVWLSEIILQQTRVAQGLPYYNTFSHEFPTIYDLAYAPEEKVLKLWQGLGYYSRARNLHFTAKHIVNEYKGFFPNTYKELLSLKGVGDYTASAIVSICFNKPTAVVDGNVYRVLSRVFGIDTPINSAQGIKEFKSLAQELIVSETPGIYNQAIMEFGARYCVPANPNCLDCIFNNRCEAFRKSKVGSLPVKIKNNSIKKRYFNYIVFLSEKNETLLQQRTQKGIWQHLFEFPLIETKKNLKESELIKTEAFEALKSQYDLNQLALYNEEVITHKLSHQYLYTKFWIVNTSSRIDNGIAYSKINDFAMPTLIANFINEFSVFKRFKN